jgi:hypothetical protein
VDVGRWKVWCGSGAPPNPQQNECNCLVSIIATHSNFTCKEKMKVSTVAVCVHPPSAPQNEPKISQWGGVCSGGGAHRVCRIGVCRLHCEHALIMFDLYS